MAPTYADPGLLFFVFTGCCIRMDEEFNFILGSFIHTSFCVSFVCFPHNYCFLFVDIEVVFDLLKCDSRIHF